MKKWIYLIVSITILSCETTEEDAQENLSVESAKSVLIETSDEIETDVIEMVQSKGVEALLDLAGLYEFEDLDYMSSSRKLDTKSISQEMTRIANAFAINMDSDDEFYSGVYEWSDVVQDFVLIQDDVDFLEVRFPALGSMTNNANFIISEIEFSESDDEFTSLVTQIEAKLVVDGVLVAALNLSLEYNDVLFVIQANVNLYLAPFDYNLEFIDSEDKQTNLRASIYKDDDKLMSVDIEVLYEDLDKFDMESVDGELSIRDMSISGVVNVAALENTEEVQEFNQYLELELWHNGSKVGDIEVDDTGDSIDLFVVYEDGSKESLLDLFEESIIEIEDILIDFELNLVEEELRVG